MATTMEDLERQQAILDMKKKALKTQGMKEFVIKIDMNLDAPIVNTGCIIPVDNGKFTRLWIVVNMQEFGPFIEADQLYKIKELLTKGTKKSIEMIHDVHPTVVCAPCIPVITMEMLTSDQTGNLMMGLHLMNAYLKNQHNRLCGHPINYCHFASRCHVYFNRYPAGLKSGTNIMMAGDNFTPHLLSKLEAKDQVFLYDLIPEKRSLMLITGDKKKFEAKTELFWFPEKYGLQLSEQAAILTRFLAIYEAQSNKLIDASTSKSATKPKKPAKKSSKKSK